jgi:hypothetical protein
VSKALDYKLFMGGQRAIEPISESLTASSGPDVNPFHFYTSLYIAYLQNRFMLVEDFKWSPDEKESGIKITSQKIKDVSEAPAIVVMRTVSQTAAIAINDMMDKSKLDEGTGREYTENEKYTADAYGDIMSGHFAVGCLSTEGTEAEHLAWIVGGYTKRGAQELRSAGFHNIGANIQFGPETGGGVYFAGEDPPPNLSSVTVVVPYFVPTLWHKLPVREQVHGKTTVQYSDEDGNITGTLDMLGRLKAPKDKAGRPIDGNWEPLP